MCKGPDYPFIFYDIFDDTSLKKFDFFFFN